MTDLGLVLVSALWRLLSALPVLVIGVLSLRGGAARPRGAFAFGLFACTWGLQIAAGNMATLTDDPGFAAVSFLLFAACLAPATYFLVEFAAAQSGNSGSVAWRVGRIGAGAIAAAASLLVLTSPELFVSIGGADGVGRNGLLRGPLVQPLIILFFAAFGLTLWSLAASWRAAPSPRARIPPAAMLAGLGISIGATSGQYLVRYGAYSITSGVLDRVALTLLFAVLATLLLVLSARALAHARAARTPAERTSSRWVAVALGAPVLWGAFEGALNSGPLPAFSTLGLWRIAGMAVIAYGLARWRLPDLPQRTAKVAAKGAGVTAAAATSAAAYGAATLVATTATSAIVAIVVLAATFLPAIRIAQRLFGRARQPTWTDDDAIYGARVDAYRAAVESSLARGSLEEDADFLAALRERFGITDSEERLLRHYAKACVLVPRAGDAQIAYERLRLLGEGGAGRTWLARDRVRDRLVVLKEPLERWQREPTMREAVLREARLAAKVRHPNVIRVEDVLEHRGSPIIVMDFAEGGSLAEMLRRRGVLPWRDAVDLLLPILRGVEAIHAHGIVHRDLKPSNVLLTLEGEPKIADFGIALAARQHDDVANDRTVVDGTTLVGTYAYMAPEVRTGALGDRRSDVYACAAMLHEALYGSPPNLAAPVLADNVVPRSLAAILARALSADPTQRPPTARALAEELTSLRARPQVL